jgi:hypothetical protein
MAFGEFGKRVARSWPPLDQVIRHENVDYILRAALRHMTSDAIVGGWMRAFRDELIKRCGVALAAHLSVMAVGCVAA